MNSQIQSHIKMEGTSFIRYDPETTQIVVRDNTHQNQKAWVQLTTVVNYQRNAAQLTFLTILAPVYNLKSWTT